jgi:hypothetical protein
MATIEKKEQKRLDTSSFIELYRLPLTDHFRS